MDKKIRDLLIRRTQLINAEFNLILSQDKDTNDYSFIESALNLTKKAKEMVDEEIKKADSLADESVNKK